MLWRAAARGALRPLRMAQPPRPGHGGKLLPTLRLGSCLSGTVVARDSDLHCPSRGIGAHATAEVPHLHIRGLLAVVLCPGLGRHEAGRTLGHGSALAPGAAPVGLCSPDSAPRRSPMVCAFALAEPDAAGPQPKYPLNLSQVAPLAKYNALQEGVGGLWQHHAASWSLALCL